MLFKVPYILFLNLYFPLKLLVLIFIAKTLNHWYCKRFRDGVFSWIAVAVVVEENNFVNYIKTGQWVEKETKVRYLF